jgi:hypothetical protein
MGASCLSTMGPIGTPRSIADADEPCDPAELQAGAREAVVKDEPKAVGITEAQRDADGVVAISACVMAGPLAFSADAQLLAVGDDNTMALTAQRYTHALFRVASRAIHASPRMEGPNGPPTDANRLSQCMGSSKQSRIS